MWGLEAEQLFDGDRFVDRPTVLIDHGKVVAVGEAIPESVEVTSLKGTLMPGMVDCHQHLVFDGNGTLEDQIAHLDDAALTERARSAAELALAGGVTTLRDLGDRGFVTLGLRDDPDLPTIVSAGPPITRRGGHCWFLGGEVDGADELAAAVADRVERGCDVVKIMVTGGVLTPACPIWECQFTHDEVRFVVDEAHRHGLPVAAHCHGVDGIVMAIDVGVDSIEHCTFVAEGFECLPEPQLLERLARSGIALSATWGVSQDLPVPSSIEKILPIARRAVGDIHAAGGVVVVGTDAGINPAKPHDVLPHAFEMLVGVGQMTTTEALAAITSVAAKLVRAEGRGRLAPGCEADIVAIDGDPRTDPSVLTSIAGVWKSGLRRPLTGRAD